MSTCKECGKSALRSNQLYCSNKCQNDFQYHKYIEMEIKTN